MATPMRHSRSSRLSGERGYSMIELDVVAVAVLTVISGAMLDGVFKITRVSGTDQQPFRNARLGAERDRATCSRKSVRRDVSTCPRRSRWSMRSPPPGHATIKVNSVTGMFNNMLLLVGTGDTEETITVTSINTGTNEITANFVSTHPAASPVQVWGGFRAGVMPPSMTNGSTGTKLKIFGDINDNGQMVYIEMLVRHFRWQPLCRRSTLVHDHATKTDADRRIMALLNHIIAES